MESLFVGVNLVNTQKLMAWLRFVVMDSDRDGDWDVKVVDQDIGLQPVSIKVEIDVWKYIKECCQKHLDGYPTSREEDVKILEEGKDRMSYMV